MADSGTTGAPAAFAARSSAHASQTGDRAEEILKLQARINELEQEARETRRLATVGATMAGLAHSVRSTLSLCRGATHLLDRALRKDDRSEIDRAWAMVKRSSSRTAELVGALLDPEKAGCLLLAEDDPHAVIRDVAEIAFEQAMDQGDELVLELCDGLGTAVFDRQALRRCCVELVGNALDALAETPETGTLTVATEVTGTCWTLSFADTGPGMAPDHVRKALAGGYTSKGKGGSGLGLSQARQLVRSHGGTVEMSSELGKGTVITCRFPLDPRQAQTVGACKRAPVVEANND